MVLFIECQGYNIDYNILYQDNKGVIILEANVKRGSSKRIRTMNICYFLFQFQVEKGNIPIKYFPTYEMYGDFMKNPMEGTKFTNFRNNILGGKE